MAQHTALRLAAAYARGERTFHHWDLRDADLHGVDLAGADLRGARLSGADLRDTLLSAVNLTAADLSAANLSGADLSDAQMGHAILRRARLDDANLSGADLSAACLEAATLRRALLEDAVLALCDLSRADLSRADLSRALLVGARARGTVLDGATLAGADLALVDLTNATLGHAVLARANLKGAQLLGACLDGADVRSTRLADARLSSAAQTQTPAPRPGDAPLERAHGRQQALALPSSSMEHELMHPVPGAEHTCAMPLVAQWLQRAAARQAYWYMQGEAEPATEVVALVRLHEYARTYLCPVTRIPRSGDEPDILCHLLSELPEDLRAEAEPVIMAAELNAQLAALEDAAAEEEELDPARVPDASALPEAPVQRQGSESLYGNAASLFECMQRLQHRGDESWARLHGVMGCMEDAYRLRAQTHEKLSKTYLFP